MRSSIDSYFEAAISKYNIYNPETSLYTDWSCTTKVPSQIFSFSNSIQYVISTSKSQITEFPYHLYACLKINDCLSVSQLIYLDNSDITHDG